MSNDLTNQPSTVGTPRIGLHAVVSRRFPLMKYEPWRDMPEQLEWLPWELLAPHDEQAKRNHGGQNLEKLASRGGLSACEAVAIIEDTDYRKMWPFPIHSREEGKDRCIKANNRLREILTTAGATANNDLQAMRLSSSS